MARKPSGISTAGSPTMKDDFRLINGIGPVFSRRLYDAGIFTYVQLASLSSAELSQVVGGLSVKILARQDWTAQARKLALENKRLRHPKKEMPKRSIHQHYENFTIEFLLDEKNNVRRTHLVHIQSGDSDTWAGWEADQLFDFIVRHTGVRIPSKQLQKQDSSTNSQQLPKNSGSFKTAEIKKITPSAHFSSKLITEPSDTKTIILASHPPTISDFAGILHIQDLEVIPIDADFPIYSLRQNQPCRVRFTVVQKNAGTPNNISINSKVTINFKNLAGNNYLIAEEHNINFSDRVTLDINCSSPPPGLYRPSVFVKLFSSDGAEIGPMATTKGDLIQVL